MAQPKIFCYKTLIFKGSDQWKMRGVEKLANVRRLYRTVAINVCFFLWSRRLFCNVFPFPVCKAQLIGDWYENRRGARNTIIFFIIRQYYWRPDAPCANSNGGPNTKKIRETLLAHHAWSGLRRGRGTSVRQYIGAPIHPAPIVLAHQHTRCANNRWKSVYLKKLNESGGPNISVRLTYFHDYHLPLTGLYKQETEIRWRKDESCIKK